LNHRLAKSGDLSYFCEKMHRWERIHGLLNLTDLFRLDPKFAGANDQGRWVNKRDPDKLLADSDEALRRNPRDAAAYCVRGLVKMGSSHGNAIAEFDEAIRLDRDFLSAFLLRGFQRQWEAYLESKTLHESSPGNSDCMNAIYLCLDELWLHVGKKRDGAFADYAEAIRLSPQDARPYAFRALAWEACGKIDEAIADLTESLRLDPKRVTTYTLRGILWLALKEYDRAIADLTEAIRLKPNWAQAYKNLGEAWARKGEYARAIADLTEAIRLEPWTKVFLSHDLARFRYKTQTRSREE